MEPVVLNWFYQTEFWAKNKEHISFIPQFKIGKYLKQLDPQYTYPDYQVDFLLVYGDESGKTHSIVIEYDGFREHFGNADRVTKYNFEKYYSDEDVYREKVLESYGYKFLRINKFNIGENPIATLNKRIFERINGLTTGNGIIESIQDTVKGLQSGEMKECPKCHEVRTMEDFKDFSLLTGFGRICNHCKGTALCTPARDARTEPAERETSCPQCGSKMVLRNGRYGRFYGCSRFPYCKGTRNYR